MAANPARACTTRVGRRAGALAWGAWRPLAIAPPASGALPTSPARSGSNGFHRFGPLFDLDVYALMYRVGIAVAIIMTRRRSGRRGGDLA